MRHPEMCVPLLTIIILELPSKSKYGQNVSIIQDKAACVITAPLLIPLNRIVAKSITRSYLSLSSLENILTIIIHTYVVPLVLSITQGISEDLAKSGISVIVIKLIISYHQNHAE
jgi:hypothetical protein